jgi:hypothetical protein
MGYGDQDQPSKIPQETLRRREKKRLETLPPKDRGNMSSDGRF